MDLPETLEFWRIFYIILKPINHKRYDYEQKTTNHAAPFACSVFYLRTRHGGQELLGNAFAEWR